MRTKALVAARRLGFRLKTLAVVKRATASTQPRHRLRCALTLGRLLVSFACRADACAGNVGLAAACQMTLGCKSSRYLAQRHAARLQLLGQLYNLISGLASA
jgi:hypothetical protein